MSVAYLPEEGIAAVGRPELEVLVAPERAAARPDAAAELARAGLLHGGVVDDRLRPLVDALTGAGGWLLVQTTARGHVTRTSLAARAAGTALVTRLPDDDRYHLGWIEPGATARHVARRLGLGPHVLARARIAEALPMGLGTWEDVRAAFATERPGGWATGAAAAALHELRWRPGAGAAERTVQVAAALDGYLADVTPPAATGGGFRITPADTRATWRRLCQVTRPGWRPAPDPSA